MTGNLEIDRDHFLSRFPDHHFSLRHHLQDHPLFSLERLEQLASELPPPCIEFNAGNAAVSQNPATTPRTRLTVEETIRSIDRSGSWVVLKYVEFDPEYRELLEDCVREVLPLAGLRAPGVHQLEAYIFISSPEAVTPFHFDDEHNFLLQLRGSKAIHTWRRDGAGGPTGEDLERFYCQGAHRNLSLRAGAEVADKVFSLDPGEGVFVPAHSTHWVKNGDRVSVSFSITFRSRPLAREVLIHKFNGRMRRLGLSPRPPGQREWVDRVKYLTVRVLRAFTSRVRGLRYKWVRH